MNKEIETIPPIHEMKVKEFKEIKKKEVEHQIYSIGKKYSDAADSDTKAFVMLISQIIINKLNQNNKYYYINFGKEQNDSMEYWGQLNSYNQPDGVGLQVIQSGQQGIKFIITIFKHNKPLDYSIIFMREKFFFKIGTTQVYRKPFNRKAGATCKRC